MKKSKVSRYSISAGVGVLIEVASMTEWRCRDSKRFKLYADLPRLVLIQAIAW